jgi:flagella basal body P-ring formation protein FlgA
MTLKLRPLILLALLAPAPALAAGGIENLDALERRLVISLGADIGQPGGPRVAVDRRMKLAACPAEVVIDPPAMGAVALRCVPLGWRIRVPLLAGGHAAPVAAMAIVAPPVKREPVIRRGDPVELAAGTATFRVTSEVIAEQDGAPGDRIRVRADRKSPPMLVEVIAAGHARLPGFK